MPIFTATFSAVAVSAAQDVFELTTHASSKIIIREVRLGQYSDFGDAAAEILSVQIIRGYTVSGSGGSAVTPTNIEPWSRTAVTVVEANNTTVANTGTGAVIVSDVMNVAAGWWYYPDENERPMVDVSSRIVVRITAPADALTMNGTIVFEEIGQ